MNTPQTQPDPKKNRKPLFLGLIVLLLGVGAYFGWKLWKKPDTPPVKSDMTAAMNANLRGVGLIWKYDYVEAAKAFEEAVKHAPDWTPAKINLGIALLNQNSPEALEQSRTVLNEALSKEPDNPYTHYSLGMIDYHQTKKDEAYAHFAAVNRHDPQDAFTWVRLGETHPDGEQSSAAKECFARALALNPYLVAARYRLAMHPLIRNDEKTKKQLMDDFLALTAAKWAVPLKTAYSCMGPYAEVIGGMPPPSRPEIGPLPMFAAWDRFKVKLADGTKWATKDDLGTAPTAELRRAVRARFGSTIILLDFNRDGKPDLFLASAGVNQGKLSDLLLRNDGDGVFTDVTKEAGIEGAALGGAAGDFDNDGQTDLLLTGIGAPRLYRNVGKGRFENVAPTAGINDLQGVFLGATWVDLDQDGDLDLILSRYAESPETALASLDGKGKGGGFVVFLNIGEAPPLQPGQQEIGGISTKFQPWQASKELDLSGAAVGAIVSDVDDDRDLDWLLLADGKPARGVWNDRLLRFRQSNTLGEPANWNGALVLDVNHDLRSDLLLLPAGKPPVLWLNKQTDKRDTLSEWFAAGGVNSPPLMQAQAVDLDRDSWTDVVGLSNKRQPVLLHNEGEGKLVQHPDAFGPADGLPQDSLAALTADLDGDGAPDLLLLSEAKGLEVRRNQGNSNHALRLAMTGKRGVKDTRERTNADAVGAWVFAQVGSLVTGLERTTLQAGLGQSHLPVELGIGKAREADVVRIRWPEGVPQAELHVAAEPTIRIITEIDRKPSSCPIFFVWDGKRYRYVTDFIGGGALGELGGDGQPRPPRPEESVKIEPGMLVPRDGSYRIKVTSPMDEVLYLDHFELAVVDHPSSWSVYPDERFIFTGPAATQELLFLTDARHSVKARDHRGYDMLDVLRERDRRMVDRFRVRSWLGYAEDHWLELDFGPLLNPNKKDRHYLLLSGWTDYPYPESMWAAQQAGVELIPPQFEVPGSDGKWLSRGELGFPAGLPRTMTREVTELLPDGKSHFRIRGNMQVYWDQITLARRVSEKEVAASSQITTLGVSRADLRRRGFAQESSPDGSRAIVYDDERNEMVAVTKWKGRLTRLGDVTELTQKQDDQFVLCGPADEVELSFDASKLPTLPKGWTRSFVMKAAGYTKDVSPFTVTGAEVYPLPFRAMKNYPPPQVPKDIAQKLEEYDRRWNTRQMSQ